MKAGIGKEHADTFRHVQHLVTSTRPGIIAANDMLKPAPNFRLISLGEHAR